MVMVMMMYLPPPDKGLQGPWACAQSVRIPASSWQWPPVPSPPGCSRHAHRIALNGCGVRLALKVLQYRSQEEKEVEKSSPLLDRKGVGYRIACEKYLKLCLVIGLRFSKMDLCIVDTIQV